MGLFKTISDMFTGAGAVQSNQVSRDPHTQLVRTKTAELEYKRELLKEKNIENAMAVVEQEKKNIANRTRELEVVEKTRGKFEDFVHCEIKVESKQKVYIDYYFSAKEDDWKLLIFRCRDSLPLDADDLLEKFEKGTVNLIERRTVLTNLHNEVTEGHVEDRLNGRLYGSVADEPHTGSGKQVFYYCVMLQTHQQNLIYLDGKQAILEKYSREEVEEFKQRKYSAKAKTQEKINEIEKILNSQQKTVFSEFQETLDNIVTQETINKKEIEAIENLYIKKVKCYSFLTDEQKEDLIDLIEDQTAQYLAQ